MAKKKTTKKATTTKTDSTGNRAAKPRQKRVALTYDAPDASSVAVTGSFCGWDEGVPLKKDRSGRWKTTLTLSPGDYEYRFLVDGEWRDDPNCTERTVNRYGTQNCILHA